MHCAKRPIGDRARHGPNRDGARPGPRGEEKEEKEENRNKDVRALHQRV